MLTFSIETSDQAGENILLDIEIYDFDGESAGFVINGYDDSDGHHNGWPEKQLRSSWKTIQRHANRFARSHWNQQKELH